MSGRNHYLWICVSVWIWRNVNMLKCLIVEGPPGCLSSWQCSQAWLQVFGLLQMLLSSYGRRGSMRLSLLILQAMPGKTENAAKPRFRASARHGVSRHGRMWEEWCSACSPQRGNLRKRRECEIEEGRTDFWVGQEIQGSGTEAKQTREGFTGTPQRWNACVIRAVMRCTMHQSPLQRALTDHVKHLYLPSKNKQRYSRIFCTFHKDCHGSVSLACKVMTPFPINSKHTIRLHLIRHSGLR